MRLSYDACWQTAASLMRAHAELLLIITGVFLLLPMLAQTIYLPPPPLTSLNPAAIEAFLTYYQVNFFPVLLVRLAMIAGTGCLFALLLAPDTPTVGESIRRAGGMVPTLFLADILFQILIAFGVIALILPGLYLFARGALIKPVIMIEHERNPITALRRSFALTHGLGWQVFGLIAIVMIVAWIGTSAILTVFGVFLQLILPQSAMLLVRAVLSALSPALLMLIYTLINASIYQQLIAQKGAR